MCYYSHILLVLMYRNLNYEKKIVFQENKIKELTEKNISLQHIEIKELESCLIFWKLIALVLLVILLISIGCYITI